MTQFLTLTTEQMIEVDRAMLEDYYTSLLQMMENAGRHLARLARSRFLNGDPRGKKVMILAGSGGNGGGGLVCARNLHNWGALVAVALTQPVNDLRGVPACQLNSLRSLGITPLEDDSLSTCSRKPLFLAWIRPLAWMLLPDRHMIRPSGPGPP